jgi:broad specificity phosphatase PhoE
MRRIRFRRTLFVLLVLAVAVPQPAPVQSQSVAPGASVTTVVVVRHAEKDTDHPSDPSLTAAGRRRAEALVAVVEMADVVAIYSTQFRRTRGTVEPLSRRLGLPVTVRESAQGRAAESARALAHEILTTHSGRSVVVVGHSNTVPHIVQALSGRAVAEITEQEYEHLFVVVVPGEGGPRVFKTRYGAANPQ